MEDERLPVVMQAGQGLGGSQWEPKLPLHSSRRLSSSQSLSSTAGSTSTGINKNNTSSSQLNLSVQGGGGGGGGGGASPATATNTFEVHQSTVTSQEQQQQPFFDQNTGIWWAADGLHYWDGNQWTLATIGTTLNGKPRYSIIFSILNPNIPYNRYLL